MQEQDLYGKTTLSEEEFYRGAEEQLPTMQREEMFVTRDCAPTLKEKPSTDPPRHAVSQKMKKLLLSAVMVAALAAGAVQAARFVPLAWPILYEVADRDVTGSAYTSTAIPVGSVQFRQMGQTYRLELPQGYTALWWDDMLLVDTGRVKDDGRPVSYALYFYTDPYQRDRQWSYQGGHSLYLDFSTAEGTMIYGVLSFVQESLSRPEAEQEAALLQGGLSLSARPEDWGCVFFLPERQRQQGDYDALLYSVTNEEWGGFFWTDLHPTRYNYSQLQVTSREFFDRRGFAFGTGPQTICSANGINWTLEFFSGHILHPSGTGQHVLAVNDKYPEMIFHVEIMFGADADPNTALAEMTDMLQHIGVWNGDATKNVGGTVRP